MKYGNNVIDDTFEIGDSFIIFELLVKLEGLGETELRH